jgi:hypothetical protein
MSDYETLNVGPGSTYNINPDANDVSFEMFDILECPNCPNDSEMMTTNDGNRNQTCLSCKTVLMKDGKMVNQTENKNNTRPQKKVNNPGFSSFMPDHMQDYMKELYDIHCRIHNINQNEKKDDTDNEKSTDGEL